MKYKVDATFGVSVNVGDKVKKGDKLGLTPDLKDVEARKEGVIKNIIFNGEKHIFLIEVEE